MDPCGSYCFFTPRNAMRIFCPALRAERRGRSQPRSTRRRTGLGHGQKPWNNAVVIAIIYGYDMVVICYDMFDMLEPQTYLQQLRLHALAILVQFHLTGSSIIPFTLWLFNGLLWKITVFNRSLSLSPREFSIGKSSCLLIVYKWAIASIATIIRGYIRRYSEVGTHHFKIVAK